MSRYYIYDSYTDKVAEFAKKDERRNLKLNSLGLAAASGLGLGTVGATVAGARYLPKAGETYRRAYAQSQDVGQALGAAGKKVRGAVRRDMGGMNLKNAQRQALVTGDKIKSRLGKVRDALYSPTKMVTPSSRGVMANDAVSALVKVGKTPRRLTPLGVAALGGAGLIAGGGALAGGLAAKKALDKRKKERNSIKGRVRSLLGR